MKYSVSIKHCQPASLHTLGDDFTGSSCHGDTLSFNNYYMEKNGAPFFAVSGEFHYSRMDDGRWEDEIIKMRMGGLNIIATYLFWNHIEEDEGVFDFSGCRNLRKFVELCGKHGMYVILRVGPFDHGEARNGGLPDWLYGKPFEVRHTNEGFMRYVRRLYGKIGEQVRGLFFKDGGPVIAVQLDNEYMHSSAAWEMTTGISNEWIFSGDEGEKYLMALRQAALDARLIPAFFTGTAWGGAAYSPRIIPLWGGYAYWPWIFYSHTGEHPATPGYVYEDYHHDGRQYADDFAPAYAPSERPYACCEMGGGMMCCYYYRFQLDYKSVDAMANVKLGSGCNFIGYYMFQGGTNPLGKHGAYLNESQVPKRSYDYQAALGEFGQIRESYSRLKAIHYFTQSFGARLAPMETILPEGASKIDPTDLETLRFAVRTDGKSGFLFLNNFQDHRIMSAKERKEINIETDDVKIQFLVDLASSENAILPFNFDMDGILLQQANAQPVARTTVKGRTTYVFMIPDGIQPSFRFEDTARVTGDIPFFTVRKDGDELDVMALTRAEANRLFLLHDGSLLLSEAAVLEDEQETLRLETTEAKNMLRCYPADRLDKTTAVFEKTDGVWGVYHAAAEEKEISMQVENVAPHRWTISLPANVLDGLKDARLQIHYQGDIGTLWLNDEMISDNFCNGDVWEVGLMEQKARLSSPMVLNIAPLREGARVNVESAMAARNEEVRQIVAQLKDVKVQPVYEIKL